ncbi:MAG TPA: hydrogenase maturation protease [Blastocatellia bacterium]|nr:hydrogenase maturation protease [Blastocatellia bacterium]
MLILGVGNVLMGDEGIGVNVVRAIEQMGVSEGVECMDGGTGGFHLLGPMQEAGKVVLIDATIDGARPGTVRRLRPRFSSDYPRTLTAHDIGLKDLLDAFYLLGDEPDVTLFAVSIDSIQPVGTELSPELAERVDDIARMVIEDRG